MKGRLSRWSLYLLVLCMLPAGVAGAKTAERFLYRNVSDVITLDEGGQEFEYRFQYEDWNIDGWDVSVTRNQLTYRRGLWDRIEVGASQMYSCVSYDVDDWHWGSSSGFNDMGLYGKYQIVREEDWPVTVSVGGNVFAPTGHEGDGFGVGDWYTGEFVAISKVVDSWRFGGSFGRVNIDQTGWNDYNHWSVGARSDFGLNLEVIGSQESYRGEGNRLLGVAGIWLPGPGLDGAAQFGLLIPMDGSDMNLGFIFSLGGGF